MIWISRWVFIFDWNYLTAANHNRPSIILKVEKISLIKVQGFLKKIEKISVIKVKGFLLKVEKISSIWISHWVFIWLELSHCSWSQSALNHSKSWTDFQKIKLDFFSILMKIENHMWHALNLPKILNYIQSFPKLKTSPDEKVQLVLLSVILLRPVGKANLFIHRIGLSTLFLLHISYLLLYTSFWHLIKIQVLSRLL